MDNWLFTSAFVLLGSFIPIFILLGSIWFWIRRPTLTHFSTQNYETPANTLSNMFHGVSIKPCSHSCKQVCSIGKVRFLPDETPRLPIDGCSNPQCTCIYTHHRDRRFNEDRRFRFLNAFAKNKRRNKLERRYQNLT
jgi:hypothetical protein